MPNFWNTLATSDLERSRAFYKALGFDVRPGPDGVPCFTVHPNAGSTICMFVREAFETMIPGRQCDTSESQELVQSLGYDSRAEVDEVLQRARDAGAGGAGEGKEQPFGYAGGFTDPDGHVWAVLSFTR